MKKIEEQNQKNKKNSSNKKVNKQKISKKNEPSKEFDFFLFLNQQEEKKEKNNEEYINPKLLIEQLKKEEEDTKILLNKLKGCSEKHKKFIKQKEKNENSKERHDIRKEIRDKKNLMAKELKKEIIKDENNIQRGNKMAQKINSQVFQYFNDKENNLDFNKKLILFEDNYKENINKVDFDIYKNLSEYKYLKAQNENKIIIEQRKKLEEERKRHLKKMEKDNLKYQRLVQNNFKIENNNSKNNLLKFKEEKTIKGNKSSPNELIKKEILINNKFGKTTKDEV